MRDPRISRREALQLMGVAAGGLAFGACGGSSTQTGSRGTDGPARNGGVLRVATPIAGATESIDPLKTITGQTLSFVLWDRLTWVDPRQEVVPELATKWSSNDALTEWTFSLRPGVTFHDGRRFGARDVVYTFKRMLDPQLASQALATWAPLLDADGVSAADDETVVFRLKRPAWDLPALVADNRLAIMPAGMSSDDIAERPVGTGPYKFKSFTPGTSLIGLRNASYWRKGYPKPDEIRLINVDQGAQRVNGLRAGQFDLATDLTPLDARTLEGARDVKLQRMRSGDLIMLWMVASIKPFDDARVRKALKLVVDRDAMVEQLISGQGMPSTDQPISPVAPIWDELPIPKQDIEGAKRLLAEAGHPNGLDIAVHTTNFAPNLTEMAQLYGEQAKAAGVRVKVQEEPSATYIARELGYKMPFFAVNFGMRPSGLLIDIIYGPRLEQDGRSLMHWKHPDYGSLYDDARSEPRANARRAKYGALERLIADDANTMIPIFTDVIEASRKVVGYEPNSIKLWRPLWRAALAK